MIGNPLMGMMNPMMMGGFGGGMFGGGGMGSLMGSMFGGQMGGGIGGFAGLMMGGPMGMMMGSGLGQMLGGLLGGLMGGASQQQPNYGCPGYGSPYQSGYQNGYQNGYQAGLEAAEGGGYGGYGGGYGGGCGGFPAGPGGMDASPNGNSLTQSGPGKPTTYTTPGGYTVNMDGSDVKITDPSGKTTTEDWGDPHEKVNGQAVDAGSNGDHWTDNQRTILLGDGTRITMGANGGVNSPITNTSIYTANGQEVQYNNQNNTVTQNSWNPYQTERDAANQTTGETGYFGPNGNGGTSLVNLYDQSPSGQITPQHQDLYNNNSDWGGWGAGGTQNISGGGNNYGGGYGGGWGGGYGGGYGGGWGGGLGSMGSLGAALGLYNTIDGIQNTMM
jgi:hypothetical protein